MPSGGARSRSGPPPDPAALRRDRDPLEWLTLPVEGRSGPAPKMPFDMTGDEATLWAELWTMPQATEWERLRLHLEVALYCRAYARALSIVATAADRGLVVRLADSLGLNTAGLARNKWKIGIVAVDPAASSSTTKTKRRPSARERLSLVPGGGA